jgi:hypothetical protein
MIIPRTIHINTLHGQSEELKQVVNIQTTVLKQLSLTFYMLFGDISSAKLYKLKKTKISLRNDVYFLTSENVKDSKVNVYMCICVSQMIIHQST